MALASVSQGGQIPPSPNFGPEVNFQRVIFSVKCSDYCPPPPLNFESGYGPACEIWRVHRTLILIIKHCLSLFR